MYLWELGEPCFIWQISRGLDMKEQTVRDNTCRLEHAGLADRKEGAWIPTFGALTVQGQISGGIRKEADSWSATPAGVDRAREIAADREAARLTTEAER